MGIPTSRRVHGWPALLLALGCSSEDSPARPAPVQAVVVEKEVAPAPVAAPVVTPETVVAPGPRMPALPAGGHALQIQLIRGPEPADGSGAWTRVALQVVDVAGTTQAAATTGRFTAPCSDAPLAAGDLARWVCWWAGGGWNVRVLRDGDGVALRTQLTDEGLTRPAKWQDQLWLAVPAGPELVVHRHVDLAAADDRPAVPAAAVAAASPVDLRVQFADARGKRPRGFEVTLRVQDGARLHALARSPWLPGTREPVLAVDSAVLGSWRVVGDDARALRLIQAGDLAVLQSQRSGAAGPEPWEEVTRVSLPHGRAARLVKK